MKNTKMDGKSINPQEELLELLKQKFPEIFAEGEVDCQKLKQTLGEEVDLDSERYGMTWAGKSNCFRVIQEPTTATLKPAQDESVDFNETENLFIDGDNLEVLKVLQKSYYGKVKMIYIDPPYNTGNDFIYNDDFRQNLERYQQEAGIKDDNGNLRDDGLMKNTRDRGHYHSDWLNMMYPRLFLARNLLRKDGVIFVSIDDNEVHNLRMMMNEIFGEENFIAKFVWKRRQNADNRNQSNVSIDHEYVLVFSRNFEATSFSGVAIDTSKYKNPDNDPRGDWASIDLSGLATQNQRPNLHYEITDPNTGVSYPPNPKRGWSKSKNVVLEMIKDGRILFPKKPTGRPREKKFIADLRKQITGFSSVLNSSIVGYTTNGTREVSQIFDEKIFDFPKPVSLLKQLIQQGVSNNDIVLDFFAGSGTTAHAVMALNAEDGGNRKCISVQLPELCDEKSEAYEAGYKTIADISKERIRRAGKKITDEKGSQLDLDGNKLDTGFKVFKLDQSNFKIWRTDVKNDKELIEQMNIFVDNVKKESTQDNILYELILKSGLDLNVNVEKKKADKKVYYSLDGGKLVICLEDKLSQDLVDAILADKPEKAICLDKAFGGNDQLKTNTVLQMEAGKIDFKII